MKTSTVGITPKTLFDETSIGSMRLKNRFVRASVEDPTPNGQVTEKLLNRYEALAKGGVGTILTGYTLIDRKEKREYRVSVCSAFSMMWQGGKADGCF